MEDACIACILHGNPFMMLYMLWAMCGDAYHPHLNSLSFTPIALGLPCRSKLKPYIEVTGQVKNEFARQLMGEFFGTLLFQMFGGSAPAKDTTAPAANGFALVAVSESLHGGKLSRGALARRAGQARPVVHCMQHAAAGVLACVMCTAWIGLDCGRPRVRLWVHGCMRVVRCKLHTWCQSPERAQSTPSPTCPAHTSTLPSPLRSSAPATCAGGRACCT